MSYKIKKMPSLKQIQKLKLKQRLMVASGIFCFALVLGAAVFLYSNLGTSKQTKASGIELSGFMATLSNGTVTIQWSTESEDDNGAFIIERSANAFDYEPLTEVPGSGTSAIHHDYSFNDPAPLKNVSYYRLKQVNMDGSYTYGAIQSINNEVQDNGSGNDSEAGITEGITDNNLYEKESETSGSKEDNNMETINTQEMSVSIANSLKVFPNPAINEINIALSTTKPLNTNIDIVDLAGKLVYSQPFSLVSGQAQVKIPVNELPKGIYFVRLNDETDSPMLQKFMKQ